MPLIIPTRKTVIQSLRGFFLTEVPEWDTSTQRRSFVGGLATSLGSVLHDWYVALKRYAETEPFPQTADAFLSQGWWVDITKLTPNPAAPARGYVVATGVAGTIIPLDAELVANGVAYAVDADIPITAQTIAAASLTRSGSLATFTAAAPHFLATGQSVVISGASQSQYNGTVIITVISATAFTYAVSGSPATPATGSPLLSATFASPSITALSTGPSGNIDSGASLQFAALTDVDATALVTFDGVGGGADKETNDAYRARVIAALGTDFGSFTSSEIDIVVKQVPGVTRVWVREAMVSPPAGWPEEGQVFVAFMRDGDTNPYPTALEVATVKNLLLETCVPAQTAPEDVVVTSPTPQPVNFVFTSISPDTPSMRAAILANLEQFFREGVDYATNVLQDDYRAVIRDTYDPQTRVRLTSFALSAPAANVSVGTTSLPSLGTVTF